MGLDTRFDFGHVNLGSLKTDSDFRREAERLLPKLIEQAGEQAGKHAWEQMQRSLRRVPGFKANNSSADKQRFIREAKDNYKRQLSHAYKQRLRDYIIENLREQAKAS